MRTFEIAQRPRHAEATRESLGGEDEIDVSGVFADKTFRRRAGPAEGGVRTTGAQPRYWRVMRSLCVLFPSFVSSAVFFESTFSVTSVYAPACGKPGISTQTVSYQQAELSLSVYAPPLA